MKVVNIRLASQYRSGGILVPGTKVDIVMVDQQGDCDPKAKPLVENVVVFNVLFQSPEEDYGVLLTEKQANAIAEPNAAAQLDLLISD